ncbi:hypothetical protein SY83_20150 [Paenibacillus swuensis]|uniref:Phospholipid phosphatase n=1 Tax=Paenibacillus swuensis TaxID=1178515 RepID=A0A172TMF4_9BACL|nr:hypothetical protein [Paenibacillus swuensis]ANE48218.1 hypothetical protein SY83_20150 [Paenibacillus swuensis]
MDLWIYLLLTAAYAVILTAGIRRLTKLGWNHGSNFLLLVAFGLFYDNGLIAIGKWVGEGESLKNLSYLRYWTHAFFTPTLILVGLNILRRSHFKWASMTPAKATAWILTIGLVLYQIKVNTLEEVASLVPLREYGVLRYVAEAEGGGPVMVIIIATLLFVAGLLMAFKRRWIWMALGVAVLFVGRSLPMPIDSSALTNIYELILIVSLWFTIRHLDREN